MKNVSKFSLLHPATHASQPIHYTWGDHAIADLGLDEIAQALSMGPQYRATIKATLLKLSADAQVIDYRQQVLDDFLSSNGVAAGFEELLPLLARLRDSLTTPPNLGMFSLQETLGRLTELNTYVTCVEKLQSILTTAGTDLHSQGLCNLRDWLKEITTDETFQALQKNLPELLARLKGIPSITIGVNLDNELRP
ncbi:MAG: hypothetical protein WA821_19140, partial [Anaerolineales bacterium]